MIDIQTVESQLSGLLLMLQTCIPQTSHQSSESQDMVGLRIELALYLQTLPQKHESASLSAPPLQYNIFETTPHGLFEAATAEDVSRNIFPRHHRQRLS